MDMISAQSSNINPNSNSYEAFSHDEEKSQEKNSWSKKQFLILITSALGNFGSAACESLQAPFFPAEAEKKGLTPTIYGFIFSVNALTEFLLAPIYGKYVGKIGARFMINSGIFVSAICCILFGLLDKINTTNSFTTLAFLVTIIEAMGSAAFHAANFTIIAATFSKDVGKALSFLRLVFALGLIMGPTIGGVLYALGGYSLPFVSTGGILLLLAIASTIIFWNERHDETSKHFELSVFKVLFMPSVLLSMTAVCFGALSIEFLNVTLEPHLRQFNLNSIEVGSVFVISPFTFALFSMFWGWLSDGKVHPKLLTVVGSVIICINYLLIGPAPFMPFDSSLILIVIALAFDGFAMGTELIIPHVDAVKHAIANGFPESYLTYGMISGLWASFYQLGTFIGPLIGGILLDQVGFRNATLVLTCLQFLLAVANIVYYFVYKNRIATKPLTEKTTLFN